MEHVFFNGWQGIGRAALVGVCAYFALLMILRFSGKRTLSKMNAFDLVVTVALGSTLATILLNKNIALAEGITAFAVLVALQGFVAFISARSKTAEQIVKSKPTLLMHRGRMLHESLRSERVTESEIWSAIRSEGVARAEDVEAVILETDGSFSVVHAVFPDTLRGVKPAAAHG